MPDEPDTPQEPKPPMPWEPPTPVLPPPMVPLMPPPTPTLSVEGRVTRLLPHGFVLETRTGAMTVATQTPGRLLRLRLGDQVHVSGMFGNSAPSGEQLFLSGWATKTDQQGRVTEVPVNHDDLRRLQEGESKDAPWWQFWARHK